MNDRAAAAWIDRSYDLCWFRQHSTLFTFTCVFCHHCTLVYKFVVRALMSSTWHSHCHHACCNFFFCHSWLRESLSNTAEARCAHGLILRLREIDILRIAIFQKLVMIMLNGSATVYTCIASTWRWCDHISQCQGLLDPLVVRLPPSTWSRFVPCNMVYSIQGVSARAISTFKLHFLDKQKDPALSDEHIYDRSSRNLSNDTLKSTIIFEKNGFGKCYHRPLYTL